MGVRVGWGEKTCLIRVPEIREYELFGETGRVGDMRRWRFGDSLCSRGTLGPL